MGICLAYVLRFLLVGPLKARDDVWNSLGAGLAIQNRELRCTTAGVAYKGSTYFLITAGHCIDHHINQFWYQYQNDEMVGQAHLDSRDSGYDLGLIEISKLSEYTTRVPGGRYASNGLYRVGAETSAGGYDSHLSGTSRPVVNQRLCKTGISTGLTCGKVTTASYSKPDGTQQIVVDVLPNEGTYTGNYLSAKGDSGGALFNPADNTLVGITSQGEVVGEYSGHSAGRRAYFTPFTEIAMRYGLYLYTSSTRTAIPQ